MVRQISDWRGLPAQVPAKAALGESLVVWIFRNVRDAASQNCYTPIIFKNLLRVSTVAMSAGGLVPGGRALSSVKVGNGPGPSLSPEGPGCQKHTLLGEQENTAEC